MCLCVWVFLGGFIYEWVCSFYNGSYLSGEDLAVLAFNVE